MTQDNSSTPKGPSDPNSTNPAAPAPKPKKRKKRWLLLKIAVVLIILLGIFILLIPTIASTGMVRGIVVGQVNDAINGKVQIADWSIGWTSGVHVTGIKVLDADGKDVADVGQVDCPISLLKAASGNINVGDTRVTGVNANIIRYADGSINLLKLIKPTPPNNNPPSKLPNVTGTIHIEGNTGTVEDQGLHIVDNLDSFSVDVKIPDINQSISDDIDIHTHLNGTDFGSVKISGTVSAIKNNLVDADHLAANQTINIAGVDLSAVNAVLEELSKQMNNPALNLKITGKVDGQIVADMKSPTDVSANAKIALANLSAGGPGLKGDTVGYKSVALSLTASMAGGAVKVDLPIDATSANDAKPDHIGLSVDASQECLQQTGTLLQVVADHLIHPKTETKKVNVPGTGKIIASVDIDAANLVNQLPHIAQLNHGVSVTSGRIASATNIAIDKNIANIDSQLQITGVKGKNAGKDIQLADFSANIDIEAAGGDQPRLHKPNITVKSGFMMFNGKAEELDKSTNFDGSIDFGSLQQQVAQFVDFDAMVHEPTGQHLQLAGTAQFALQTNGDLTAEKGPVQYDVKASLNNLKISGLGDQNIDVSNFAFNTAGIANLDRSQPMPLQSIDGLKITATSPGVDFDVDGRAKMDGPLGVTLPAFSINKGTIDLAQLQKEFGGAVAFITKRNDLPRIVNGKLILAGKGEFDSSTFHFDAPLQLHIDPADVQLVDATGKPQTVHLPAADFTLNGNGVVDATKQTTTLKGLTAQATIGDAAAPAFVAQLQTDAVVSLTNVNASSVALTRCEGDLPQLQSVYAPLLKTFVDQQVPSTQPSALQQIADQTLKITTGKMTATFAASATYTPGNASVTITQPLTASLANLTVVNNGKTILSNQTVTATADAQFDQAPGRLHLIMKSLAVNLGNALALKIDPSKPLDATMIGSQIAANGDINLANADVKQLVGLAMPFVPASQQHLLQEISNGTANGNIHLNKSANGETAVALGGNLSNFQLTGHPADNMQITASANLSADQTKLTGGTVHITSSLGRSIDLNNVSLLVPGGTGPQPGMLDMVQSLDVDVEGLALTRLQVWMSVLGQVDTNQLPAVINAGSASLKAHIGRQGNTTVARLSSFDIAGLEVAKGQTSYTFPKDITIAAVANVDSAPGIASTAPILAQIGKLTITGLNFDTGILQVQSPSGSPIIVTGLSNIATMSATGAVAIDGRIPPLCRLAEILMDKPQLSLDYLGNFHFDESLTRNSTTGGVQMAGGGKVSAFQVLDPHPAQGANPIQFQENEIDISNPLTFSPSDDSVVIDKAHPITFALKSTGAVAVSIVGGVHDMQVMRKLEDGTSVTIDYDLAKLWPIIKPLVPPATLAKITDLQLTGVEHSVIKMGGSYPANKPFNQAVQSFTMSGDFGIGHISTNGITVDHFTMPFMMSAGKFYTKYVDKPEGQNGPPVADCNNGKIDLGVFMADLTGNDIMLTAIGVDAQHPRNILQKIQLNPALAGTLFKYVLYNPLMQGATQDQGLADVSIYNLSNVPLSTAMEAEVATNPGTMETKYSVTGLKMGSPVLSALPGWNDSLLAEIHNADVKLAKGVITQDTTIELNKQNLRIWGSVGLQSKQFKPMNISIPSGLYERAVPANVRQYMPPEVVTVLKGDMDHPKIDIDWGAMVGDWAKKAIGGALLQNLLKH